MFCNLQFLIVGTFHFSYSHNYTFINLDIYIQKWNKDNYLDRYFTNNIYVSYCTNYCYFCFQSLGLNFSQVIDTIQNSSYSKVFFFDDFGDQKHFLKQFLSGVFMAIVMTGLDQDQMQKNLSCKNLGEAKKNMFVFSTILIVVDLLFFPRSTTLYLFL